MYADTTDRIRMNECTEVRRAWCLRFSHDEDGVERIECFARSDGCDSVRKRLLVESSYAGWENVTECSEQEAPLGRDEKGRTQMNSNSPEQRNGGAPSRLVLKSGQSKQEGGWTFQLIEARSKWSTDGNAAVTATLKIGKGASVETLHLANTAGSDSPFVDAHGGNVSVRLLDGQNGRVELEVRFSAAP